MALNISELLHDGISAAQIGAAWARVKAYADLARRRAALIRPYEQLCADIQAHDLTTDAGTRELGEHVRRAWTCREVLFMRDFLHGGKFTSAAGWTEETAGLATATGREDGNLKRLWNVLVARVYTSIGAAAVVGIRDGEAAGAICTARDDALDGTGLWDMTLDELGRAIPEEAKRKLDAVAAVEHAIRAAVPDMQAATREGARAGVENAVPNVVLRTLRADRNAEPGADPFAPKRRNPGAGRPCKYDPDRKQVDAVVGEILQDEQAGKRVGKTVEQYALKFFYNPPEGTRNPYTKLDALAQAVKNTLKRTGQRS